MNARLHNMEAVRLGLAVLVIVQHGYSMAGKPDPMLQAGGMSEIGGWAVKMFLVLSGYAVTASGARHSGWAFWQRRLARLYPGYVVAVIFACLITWQVPTVETALRTAIFMVTPPSQIASQGLPLITLWTIPIEIAIWSGMFLLFPVIAKHRWISLVACGFAVACGLLVDRSILFVWPGLTFCFCLGMAAYLYRDVLTWRKQAPFALGLVLAGGVFQVSYLLTLGSAGLLMFAMSAPLVRLRWDISYGLYVLAFPIQWTLSRQLGPINEWVNVGATIALAVPLASALWLFVERYALGYRRCVPVALPEVA